MGLKSRSTYWNKEPKVYTLGYRVSQQCLSWKPRNQGFPWNIKKCCYIQAYHHYICVWVSVLQINISNRLREKDSEAEAPVLWLPDAWSQFIRKGPDAGKDWRQEEKGTTEDEMVGWHHRLDGHEFEQALEDDEGQGSLVCWNPWGHKGSDTTERLTATVWKLNPKICRQQAGDAEEPVWFQPKYGQAWDQGRTSISFWVWRWEKGQQLSSKAIKQN